MATPIRVYDPLPSYPTFTLPEGKVLSGNGGVVNNTTFGNITKEGKVLTGVGSVVNNTTPGKIGG